jgi:hypothetical protein
MNHTLQVHEKVKTLSAVLYLDLVSVFLIVGFPAPCYRSSFRSSLSVNFSFNLCYSSFAWNNMNIQDNRANRKTKYCSLC